MLYGRLDKVAKKSFPELFKQHEGQLDLGLVDASLTCRKLCFPHLHALAVLTQLLSDPSRSGPNSEHLDFTQSRANDLSGGEFARELQAFLGPGKLMATLCIYIDKVRARRRRSVSCSVAHQDELFGDYCTGTVRLPVEVVQVANPSVSVTAQSGRALWQEWHGHSRVRVRRGHARDDANACPSKRCIRLLPCTRYMPVPKRPAHITEKAWEPLRMQIFQAVLNVILGELAEAAASGAQMYTFPARLRNHGEMYVS